MKYLLIHKWKFLILLSSDKKLKRVELAVAAHLLNHYNLKTGKCFPSHDLLSKETGYSLRHVKTATKNLCEKNFIKKKKGHTGWANEYLPRFELIDQEKDVVQYSNQVSAAETSTKVKRNALQTINKTIYKPPSEKVGLEGYVGFVKRGQHIQVISDDMVEEMFHQGLISKEEYKKW